MSGIPSNLSRVPSLLSSQVTLRQLTSTNQSLLHAQNQLATGLRINRPSDDAIGASLVGVLDSELELGAQRTRNLQHASGVLATVDQSIAQMNDLLLEGKTIASSQVGAGSDADTRAQEAAIIASLTSAMFAQVNAQFADLSVFGGSAVGTPAMESFRGGYRYLGDRGGLMTDLGPEIDFPITLGADAATGALSARVEGAVDLDPRLTAETFLRDLRGSTAGRELGVLEVTIDGGTPLTVQVDASGAETVGDLTDAIESAIRTADPAALGGSVWPNGVTVAGDRLEVAGVSIGYTITFADGPSGQTASALGLADFTYDAVNTVNTAAAADLDPRVTDRTLLGDLDPAVAVSFGDVVFRNGGAEGTVTTAASMTVGEFREAVRRLELGIRVEVSTDGNALDVVNEVSGLRMSVSESTLGGVAAATLGIRSMVGTTLVSDLNDGRGVEIADGEIDPVTGLPDADRNVDFQVDLSDGTTFLVDLVPADLVNLQSVVDRINADAAASGLTIGTGPGEFQAYIDPVSNGIALQDQMGGPEPVRVISRNGYAAEDLGLLDGVVTAGTPAVLTGSDRATVRVASVFSTLVDLRVALETDDVRGITFAGERLEADLTRLASARALAGGRAQRVEDATARLEDAMVLDESIRSEIRDLDFVEASTRLSLLQLQLQAGVAAAAQSQPLSLLNFLGV